MRKNPSKNCKVKILNTSFDHLIKAARFLNAEHPIVFPTDTVYGIGAKLYSLSAIQQIYRLKKRNKQKLLPIFVSSKEVLEPLVESIPEVMEKLINEFWPGPLTLVVKKNKYFTHPWYRDSKYIAVRYPDHFIPKFFMEYTKEPLICSSANISYQQPLSNVTEIIHTFTSLKAVVDGGCIDNTQVSTVVRVFPEIEILREGKVRETELLKFCT